MSNSSMVSYTKISPNKNVPRDHKIDTITIHVMDGNLSLETCANIFQRKDGPSANYGIDSNGRVGMFVEEKDRSWCSSNRPNDMRAVTIEVANDGGAPDYHVSDKALATLINLVADICKRNGIKELKWKGDKSLIGQVDKQNMTVHRWFEAKACPGNYLYNKHGYIADEVNKILNGSSTPSKPTETRVPYTRVLKKGCKGSDVGQLQKDLNATNKAGLDIDNSFGGLTDTAVRNWQKVNGLQVDGSFGPASQKKMMELVTGTKSASVTQTDKSYKVKVTPKLGANIRNGAGTKYAVLVAAPQNTVLTIKQESNGWGYTVYANKTGWVKLENTKKI